MREEINKLLVKHTGQPLEKVEKDTDRDFFMTPEHAKEYGIIDEVLSVRKVSSKKDREER
jgi:ATP-dependent Clp protease protease subunit